jgi:hypothetical protein
MLRPEVPPIPTRQAGGRSAEGPKAGGRTPHRMVGPEGGRPNPPRQLGGRPRRGDPAGVLVRWSKGLDHVTIKSVRLLTLLQSLSRQLAFSWPQTGVDPGLE